MIYISERKSMKVIGTTSLVVSFEYNKEIVDIIKQAGDAIWHKKEFVWELPCNKLAYLIDNLTYLDNIHLELLEDELVDSLSLTLDYKTKPFEYQKEGIEWLINNPNSLILDPPGLGKTLQIIYTAEELKAQKGIEHCLILCGINALKTNWEKEINKHSTLSCRIIGKKVNSKGRVTYASVKERAEELYNKLDEFFIILNVESLRDNLVIDAIRNSVNKFDMIAFDEVHRAKSPSSDQGKNLLKLSKVGNYHYGMTGTVLINSPLDAYVPLKFIGYEHSTYSNFKNFYCVYEQRFGHNQIVGFKNIDILKDQIASCSLRRSKDLLKLPPKIIIPEFVSMDTTHQKFYEDIQNGIVDEADRVNITNKSLLGLVTRLRQAATCPSILTSKEMTSCKIDRALDLVDEIVSNGDKVVIFSSFKEPLHQLERRLQHKYLIGTGDLDDKEVSDNIDKFQTDPSYKVFLGTISKMSTGVTLTAASYMIFLDAPWTAADFEQACDRIYRIGSNKTVTIYNLICEGTIDERVNYLIDKKKGIADYIVDNNYNQTDELKFLLGIN